VRLPRLWGRRTEPPSPLAVARREGEALLEWIESAGDDQQTVIGLAHLVARWPDGFLALVESPDEFESPRIPLPLTRSLLERIVRADLARLREL
jgi:hypothetical protein